MARTADDFIFFWKPEQLHGWASQWYKSPFTARITLPDGKEHDVTFPTAEHWMMGQKALLFGDQKIFERISTVTAPRVPGPKEVKALGRKVGNFEEETWARERARIVREGLLHKFRQNPELRALLLATGEREIVEASHMDRVWGVGYGAKRAGEMCVSEEGRALWGANLLGRALEEVRRILRGEEEGREEKREDEEDAVRS
ncbi:DUF1768-domain-containing protein [Lentinus tigrinus ALCF2SS1-7]|uniref:DUF1768-domain-containing protein n=1 Tax=Lentinus tigrinus ALCF2SS1-7 TaxID=1328758 RepID=UPI00116611F7|nr:DUF1768-domain-containing protein [Lentinus tigrinus ALCF2SS1-7]